MHALAEGPRLQANLEGSVFVVSCNGLLTARTVRAVRRWLNSNVPAGAGAVVLDYRTAVVVIDDDDLNTLAGPAPAPVLSPPIPLAWLVADKETANAWQRQVLRLALNGQRRFASHLESEAFAWAREQAQLARAAARR